MLPVQRWTVDNSYLLEIMARPTYESDVSMNPYIFDNLFILQNRLNPQGIFIVDKDDTVGIKLREKKPVSFEVYSSKETPINVLGIPKNDFLKFISPYPADIEVTALIPKRRLRH